MASKTSKTDLYPNIMVATQTMTTINTERFTEINVGLNIFDKVGLVLHRLEYEPTDTVLQDLDDDGDTLVMGLTASSNLTSLTTDQAEVIDAYQLTVLEHGTPANWTLHEKPYIHDFSTLPGGGLLIPPKPLYIAVDSAGMTIVASFRMRIYFTILRLTDSQYLELLETRRAFG